MKSHRFLTGVLTTAFLGLFCTSAIAQNGGNAGGGSPPSPGSGGGKSGGG